MIQGAAKNVLRRDKIKRKEFLRHFRKSRDAFDDLEKLKDVNTCVFVSGLLLLLLRRLFFSSPKKDDDCGVGTRTEWIC